MAASLIIKLPSAMNSMRDLWAWWAKSPYALTRSWSCSNSRTWTAVETPLLTNCERRAYSSSVLVGISGSADLLRSDTLFPPFASVMLSIAGRQHDGTNHESCNLNHELDVRVEGVLFGLCRL